LKVPDWFILPDDCADSEVVFLGFCLANDILAWCFEEEIDNIDFLTLWLDDDGYHTAWRVPDPSMRSFFILKFTP
jgi:hypothetical protein